MLFVCEKSLGIILYLKFVINIYLFYFSIFYKFFAIYNSKHFEKVCNNALISKYMKNQKFLIFIMHFWYG